MSTPKLQIDKVQNGWLVQMIGEYQGPFAGNKTSMVVFEDLLDMLAWVGHYFTPENEATPVKAQRDIGFQNAFTCPIESGFEPIIDFNDLLKKAFEKK